MKTISVSDLSENAQKKYNAIDDNTTVYARRAGRGWELTTIAVSSEQREKEEARMTKDGWLIVVND